MRYMFMLYADEKAGAQIPDEEMQGFMDQMFAYRAALIKAQAYVDSAPLSRTDAACTVRIENGDMKVLDGPYAETREQLGGYYLIEAADMDMARTWAARCPAAIWGTIEIRQLVDISKFQRHGNTPA